MPQEIKRRKDTGKTLQFSLVFNLETFTHVSNVTLIWPQPVTLEVSPHHAHYTDMSSELTDLPGSFQQQKTQRN